MDTLHTDRLAVWAQDILSALGDEPPLTRIGMRTRETPERFLWLAGAEAAAGRLMESIGDAACEDNMCQAFILGMKAGLPVEDYNAAAAELAGTARQRGVKFLLGFIEFAADVKMMKG